MLNFWRGPIIGLVGLVYSGTSGFCITINWAKFRSPAKRFEYREFPFHRFPSNLVVEFPNPGLKKISLDHFPISRDFKKRKASWFHLDLFLVCCFTKFFRMESMCPTSDTKAANECEFLKMTASCKKMRPAFRIT